MRYDPERHHRRSIRLKGYDYSQAGAYFVTICTQDRACRFGEITDGAMRCSDAGNMIQAEWDALLDRFPTIQLDASIIMPNHVHGIIALTTAADTVRAPLVGAPPAANIVRAPLVGAQPDGDCDVEGTHKGRPYSRAEPGATSVSLGDVVGAFKSLTTGAYIRGVKQSAWTGFRGRLWHVNFYEHIIRNDDELNRIRKYIVNNPVRWAQDEENPGRIPR